MAVGLGGTPHSPLGPPYCQIRQLCSTRAAQPSKGMSNPFMSPFGGDQVARVDPSISATTTPHTIDLGGGAPSSPAKSKKRRCPKMCDSLCAKCCGELSLTCIVWWSLRLILLVFLAACFVCWHAAQDFMQEDPQFDLNSQTYKMPFILCAPGSGSHQGEIDYAAGTVTYDIDAMGCVHPSFLLNLAFVAMAFSLAVSVIYSLVAPYVVYREKKDPGNTRFSRGVISGMGIVGALLLFQSGFGIVRAERLARDERPAYVRRPASSMSSN
jgi:hypothetical protein